MKTTGINDISDVVIKVTMAQEGSVALEKELEMAQSRVDRLTETRDVLTRSNQGMSTADPLDKSNRGFYHALDKRQLEQERLNVSALILEVFAVAHAHWPNIWSWGYYVKVPQGSSPLVFPEGKEGNYYVFPQVGDLVIFPAWIKHEVPPSAVDEDRMLVGGNIERIPHKDLPLPTPEEIKKVVVPTTKPIFGKPND